MIIMFAWYSLFRCELLVVTFSACLSLFVIFRIELLLGLPDYVNMYAALFTMLFNSDGKFFSQKNDVAVLCQAKSGAA